MYINLTPVSLLNSVVPNHLFIFCFWYCGKLCHLQTITALVLFFFLLCKLLICLPYCTVLGRVSDTTWNKNRDTGHSFQCLIWK